MIALRKLRLLAIAAFAVCAAPLLANATTLTYDFSGQCSDCKGNGTAELVLQGSYTPGTDLSLSDLVSFHYDGTDLLSAFTITPANIGPYGFMDGNIPAALPGPAFFEIIQQGGEQFRSNLAGDWCAGTNCFSDQGTNGIWSVAGIRGGVPEPATWAMLMVGFSGLGMALRARRKPVAAAI